MLRNAKGFVFDLGHRNGLPMAVVMMFLPLAGLVVASYFVVRWAVAAGTRRGRRQRRWPTDICGGPRRSTAGAGGVGRSVYAVGVRAR